MQRKISFKNDGKYNTSEMCDISKKRLVFFRKKDQSRREKFKGKDGFNCTR